jgi:transposase
VIAITGNARYHHARLHRSWRGEHADSFFLDYLPPYSPVFNPIERAWKPTRRQRPHSRYFPLLSQIFDSVKTPFKQWLRGNITLRRLCAIVNGAALEIQIAHLEVLMPAVTYNLVCGFRF